jgi:CRISPR-associated protein Cas2
VSGLPGLAPPKLISLKERASIAFIEKGNIDVLDGNYSRRTREMIWEQVTSGIEGGNAVIAWTSTSDAGFDFETCGKNRRRPVDFEGLRLVAFEPPQTAKND